MFMWKAVLEAGTFQDESQNIHILISASWKWYSCNSWEFEDKIKDFDIRKIILGF
jgi:hypothetical protein